jgi:putative tryptophan/tyrosine transport system substrate-binding protein
MRRRDFIKGIAGSATAWPLAARAQQDKQAHRIGVLFLQSDNTLFRSYFDAFQQTLQQRGWVVGQNLQLDDRWAAGDMVRLQEQASELVGLHPDIFVTSGAVPLSILRQQAGSLPIVFAGMTEPVITGFVSSMEHPGGNITGFTNFEFAMVGKWLQLLKEIAPAIKTVGLMQNPHDADWPGYNAAIKPLSSSFGVELVASPVRDPGEIEKAVSVLASEPSAGLIVLPDALLIAKSAQVIDLASRHRVPAVYAFRLFSDAGGLVSYGPNLPSVWRGAASYVDRILRGEKPGDLPVQAATKFDLIINLKTAKALGLNIPPTLLATADEVIE